MMINKGMKRIVVALMALALLTAFAVPALASADVRKTTKSVKVYEDTSTSSEVLKKLGKGKEVLVDVDYGSWVGVLVEDPYGDGQTIGWIQSKYLECKHEWSEWVVEREPTCTRAGKRTRYCYRCGKEQTKEIEKLGHKFGKWKVVRTATCAKDGLRVRTCKVCGYEEEKTFREDHTYGPWKVTRQATCTEEGLRKRTCEVCGHVDTQTLDKKPHDFEYKVIVEATDHSSGTRAQVCRVCGYTTDAESYDPEGTLRRGDRGDKVRQLQQLLVDQGYLNVGGADSVYGGGTERAVMKFQTDQGLTADGVAWPQTQKRLSHDFGPWETVKPLTRTEPGVRQRVCRDCGYVQTETVEVGDIIERGSRGENVRAIQQILKQTGYDAGSFDGIYGKKLDTAFTQFDADHGLTFEPGKVRPADVDALVSAWLAASAEPLKACDADTPVNLALSVTPSSDETSDSDVTTYHWSLTNLGTQKCMFNALLLTYGSKPDFNGDDLVMVIDGEELKPNAGNSVSGSFSVAKAWSDGNKNFAAMAVSDSTGEKWLSNIVVFESAAAGEPKTVEPLPVDINVLSLPDGTYPVAFDRGDIAKLTSGIFMNAVHIFTMDTYDGEAIQTLVKGDTVVVEGREIAVETVENRDGLVEVNGGSEAENGCAFTAVENGDAWRVLLDDDFATYTDRGVTTLLVDPAATFTDGWDIEKDPVTVEYADIVDAIQSSENDSFYENNTSVTLENGRVMEIRRVYVP